MSKEEKKPDSSKPAEEKKLSAGGAGEKEDKPTTSAASQAKSKKPAKSEKGLSSKALAGKLRGKNFSRLGGKTIHKQSKPQQVAGMAESLRISNVKLAAVMAHYGWKPETKLHRLDFIAKVNAWSTATV